MWGAIQLGAILESVDSGLEMSMDDALELEARIFADLTNTDDMREGVTAFIEKRRPKFQDK
jgi:enoyl-CoA hydratase/carnithine racemase